MTASEGQLRLDHHKLIEADPQMEFNLQIPLSTPKEMTYNGSITCELQVEDGSTVAAGNFDLHAIDRWCCARHPHLYNNEPAILARDASTVAKDRIAQFYMRR